MSIKRQNDTEASFNRKDMSDLLKKAAMFAWDANDIDLGIVMFDLARKAREDLADLLNKGGEKMVQSDIRKIKGILDRIDESYEGRLINTVLPTIGARLFEGSRVLPMISREDREAIDQRLLNHSDPSFRAHCGFTIHKAKMTQLQNALREHMIVSDQKLSAMDIISAEITSGSVVEIALSRAAPPLVDACDILARRLKSAYRDAGGDIVSGAWRPEILSTSPKETSTDMYRTDHLDTESLPEPGLHEDRRTT